MDDIEDNRSDDEESIPEPADESELTRNYKIVVPRQSKFALSLKFTPEITVHGKREITLPIEIKGAGKTAGIKRVRPDLTFRR